MAGALFYTTSFPYEEKYHLFFIAAFAIYCFKSKDRWEESWEAYVFASEGQVQASISLVWNKNEVPETLGKQMVWLEICKTLGHFLTVKTLSFFRMV